LSRSDTIRSGSPPRGSLSEKVQVEADVDPGKRVAEVEWIAAAIASRAA
jgi:hypothetical protein